jgi:ADP-heptose:LPS heptosyltransferase
VKNVLIYRTDRIGDFLVCSSIYSSIKRNYNNCKIDIVCSNSNYNYVKSFDIFNKVFLFPEKFLDKIKFFFSLKKYDKILVLDGKKRSIYMSIFKKTDKKIIFTPSNFIKKIFSPFFNKSYFIDYKIPKIELIIKCLNDLDCDFIDEDLTFLKKYENTNSLIYKNNYSDYLLFNFDEKWLANKYIKSYQNIEPTIDELVFFLENISKKKKIIITNGFVENHLIKKLQLIKDNTFFNRVIIKDKIDLYELQSLIKESDFFISCHGGPTHMASNYNIKLIDIIDLSEKEFFESYNHHIKNKTQLFRERFSILCEKILKIIN